MVIEVLYTAPGVGEVQSKVYFSLSHPPIVIDHLDDRPSLSK